MQLIRTMRILMKHPSFLLSKFKKTHQYLILLVALLSIFSLNAQMQKLEKVNKEMLTSTEPIVDDEASAEILFEHGKIEFMYSEMGSLLYKYEVTKRIKIYTQEGYEHATIVIPFYYGEVYKHRERIKSKNLLS